MDLAKYNLFVIGTPWGNRFIEKHLSEIPVRLTANSLIAGKKYEGRGYALISGWINPSPFRSIVSRILSTMWET